MFDESPASVRRNALLGPQGGQDGDANFLRKGPSVEGPGTDDPRSLIHRAALPEYFQRRKEGWKLFSPSTWKGLRDTAWGRKKADQRHDKRVKKQVLKDFQKKFLGFEPESRAALQHFQIWQRENAGLSFTASTPEAKRDSALATSKAYGMHADDERAWRRMFAEGNTFDNRDVRKHFHWYPKAAQRAAQNKPVGEGRMSAESFYALASARTQRGPEHRNIATGPSHRPGDVLDGYEVLPEPSSDKENNVGIPDIVRDVFAGTTRPQRPQQAVSAHDQREHQGDTSSDGDSEGENSKNERATYAINDD
jgi:hypothetical protein